MDKICQQCGEDLQCVFTGCSVYLAHTGNCHQADLFMCFTCLDFHVFGLNVNPASHVPPNVVVAGDFLLLPYSKDSDYHFVGYGTADIIPLPSALQYMREKCHHEEEVAAYLKRKEETRA